jgi:hypothetical protein
MYTASHPEYGILLNITANICEVTCYPLIRHGPRRKRNISKRVCRQTDVKVITRYHSLPFKHVENALKMELIGAVYRGLVGSLDRVLWESHAQTVTNLSEGGANLNSAGLYRYIRNYIPFFSATKSFPTILKESHNCTLHLLLLWARITHSV